MGRWMICAWLGALAATTGCVPAPKSGKGFTLPEGDVTAGQQAFERLQCNACHVVDGVPQPDAPAMAITLGGQVTRIKTYGELVTSIINPSHKLAAGLPRDEISIDGQSKMKVYNDILTVSELSDLVSFLQSKYELYTYEPTQYPIYPYAF